MIFSILISALPQGGLVYNPIGAPPPGSQPDMTQPPPEAQNTSQGQQIQSIGAPSAMTSVMPAGIQYLPAGPTPVGKYYFGTFCEGNSDRELLSANLFL